MPKWSEKAYKWWFSTINTSKKPKCSRKTLNVLEKHKKALQKHYKSPKKALENTTKPQKNTKKH